MSATPSSISFNKNRYKTARELQEDQSWNNIDSDNMKTSAVPLLTIGIFHFTTALIGYDCGGSTLNITSFSTIDKPECDSAEVTPTSKGTNIQLLQLTDFKDASVIQCRVEIDRTIYHCGMHSHVSIVQNGRQQFIMNTPKETCRQMHTTGILYLPPSTQITGLSSNQTTMRSLALAGIVQLDGTCAGGTYSDLFCTWSNVVVQAVIRITLKDFYAAIKITSNEIYLLSGQRCNLQQETCLDAKDGHTFWNSLSVEKCEFNRYQVLYDGKAILTHSTEPGAATIYTVTADETAFSLISSGRTLACGYTLIRTEHPKLLILDTKKEGRFKQIEPLKTNNLDIFTYVNTKFVYLERHVKMQVVSLYKDLLQQKCKF